MRRLNSSSILSRIGGADWGLLAGMLALSQNRFFAGKLLGVGLLMAFTPAIRWLRAPGLHRFYLAMAAWTVVEWAVVVRDFSAAYTIVAAYALGYWLMMAIAAAALRGVVERDGTIKSTTTIDAAFAVIAGLSVVSVVSTVVQAGVLNPFEQAPEPLFGMSSGDHVTGLFGFQLFHAELGDYSTVNGAVLALFAIFFAGGARWRKAALAFVLMLFTASNFLTLATLAAGGVLAVGRWRRKYLFATAAATGIVLLFYATVTPKNLRYLSAELAEKGAKFFPGPSPQTSHRAVARRPAEERATIPQKRLAGFNPDEEPGKLRAFRQTAAMLGRDARHLLAGAGPGRFSSALAMLAAAPQKEKGRLHQPLRYNAPEWRRGHGRIAKAVKAMHPRYHTFSQLPYSWYNQLPGEYGLVGVALFAVFYLGTCIRARRGATGTALLLALLLILVTDYAFEGLSVVPFFEWMLWGSPPAARRRPRLPADAVRNIDPLPGQA